MTMLCALLVASSHGADKKAQPGKNEPGKNTKPGKDEPAKENEDPHADLIGKPTPEISSDFALNGNQVNLADLKGKVVLLDFWGVWCGPCLATFPHLRDWNTQHKDKGLEIVGLTSYYQRYGFDKEAGKLVKKAKDELLSASDEQGMLKEFAAHHKLEPSTPGDGQGGPRQGQ